MDTEPASQLPSHLRGSVGHGHVQSLADSEAARVTPGPPELLADGREITPELGYVPTTGADPAVSERHGAP